MKKIKKIFWPQVLFEHQHYCYYDDSRFDKNYKENQEWYRELDKETFKHRVETNKIKEIIDLGYDPEFKITV